MGREQGHASWVSSAFLSPQQQLPPHIFGVAERAYRAMIATQRTQTVCLVGRSGAGKTTSLHYLLHYYIYCYSPKNSLLNGVNTDL